PMQVQRNLMKSKWKRKLLSLFSLAMLVAVVANSKTNASVPLPNSDATIEVIYFGEDVYPFVSYKAILKIPVGSTIETLFGNSEETSEEVLEFVLSHNFGTRFASNDSEGDPSDTAGSTQYYGPYMESLTRYVSIPGSTVTPRPIEEYIDLPEPGMHHLVEGDTFVLARVADKVYEIKIVEIASD
ncbi:MAG: hypothetical protein AAFP20_22180, partial [Cyanobacteria bacterium J06614_10]